MAAFVAGKEDFAEVEEVDEGLGPTMNLDSCGGCHAQPAVGGTSPALNPQVAFATKDGMRNSVPSFIRANGPVREVRFVRNPDGTPDGGVHALFTIRGHAAAKGCNITQPDFAGELSRRNVIFRIPTPTFGLGLIEAIPDSEILHNEAAQATAKQALGIRGRPNLVLAFNSISGTTNRNGNDGTIARFGHKAQNKSLLIFSGEAYNVEMGISNGAFPTERDETEGCQVATLPNSDSTLDGATPAAVLSSIDRFTFFMRFLAPPTPSTTLPGGSASIARGKQAFIDTGCALCHTPSMKTYNASVVAMRNVTVNLFSDLMLHDMGNGLADGIRQGQANGREFRSAPLWGVGQRLFFLHDGRTSDLKQAIYEHFSDGSEANAVVQSFVQKPDSTQQDILNFLRSL
ncbi:MAG TPA: di-heme oxidoredictase family protein [Burkholderiaceae bacterium]|nr:di-heme oxidoredictase family protein [Burkholderiaceae bacterium]